MEEKQPQDLEMNIEKAEPIAEERDITEVESAEVTAEAAEPTEKISSEEESVAEEPVEEESAEEESIEEEPIEEESKGETVAEEAPEEEPIQKEPEEAPEAPEPQEEEPVRRAAAGLVLKPWQLALAAVAIVALVVGGVVLGIVLGNKGGGSFDDSPVDYEWELPEGVQTNPDQIVLPGYVELTFPAEEQVIEIVLPNPATNPCYFRYTLMLEDSGEVLYRSQLIAPGKAVLEIKLSRPLPVGDYALLISIDSFSLADGTTPMNGGEQKVLLKVR